MTAPAVPARRPRDADASDPVWTLRAIRRGVATADPAALRRFLDAVPDVEPEGWDRIAVVRALDSFRHCCVENETCPLPTLLTPSLSFPVQTVMLSRSRQSLSKLGQRSRHMPRLIPAVSRA